jgi:AcrR family transcriptional regulator
MKAVASRRPRNAEATRAALLAAAHRQFVAHGYDGTSVRGIADEVGVDAAMVIRYFGSKDALFIEIIYNARAPQVVLDGPLETLAERLLRHAFEVWTDPARGGAWNTLLRSTNNAAAIAHLRLRFLDDFVAALAERLPGADAKLRAELIGGQLLGFGLMRNLIEAPEAGRLDIDALIAHYAPALRTCIDPVHAVSGAEPSTRRRPVLDPA